MIRTPDQRLRVFVSSTLQELADERAAAQEAIARLRLVPVLFELGARPHPPRDLYQAYLEQSHVFLGIYWQRYGWVAPDMDVSGLEDEWLSATRHPKLVYLKSPAPEREPRLEELLERIRSDNAVSYRSFTTADELGDLVENDLAVLLSERFESTEVAGTAGALGSDVGTPPPAERTQVVGSLPAPPSALIGRDVELATLLDLLEQRDCRMVTITGPGGCGKTRLATELAECLQRDCGRETHFVDLTGLHTATLVMSTIASTLGVREAEGRSLSEAVASVVDGRAVALVIDNFEHVLAAAPEIADLLSHTHDLQIVVTSRQPLHLRWEQELPLLPLAVPAADAGDGVDVVASAPAVELLVERARRVRPTFALTEENATDLADIARRLDGLPLALELAAARLRILAPGDLLDRLEHRLDALTGSAPDAPERHRTLRAAISWSVDLLDDDERRVFRRLGVFSGGAGLEAIERVCAGEDVEPTAVLDIISSLVDKSLVVSAGDLGVGQTRFYLLETVRELAIEQLLEAGETVDTWDRHLAFQDVLMATAWERFWTADMPVWLDLVDLEHDNLRTAIEHAIGSGDVDAGLRIAARLWPFWDLRGHHLEGERLLGRLLDRHPTGTGIEVGRGLSARGWLIALTGDFEEADRLMAQALPLVRADGDDHGLAWALAERGNVTFSLGHVEESERCWQEELTLARRLDDPFLMGFGLFGLAYVAMLRGDLDEMRTLLDESLELTTRLFQPWGIAWAQFSLGVITIMNGDTRGAIWHLNESLRLRWTIGDARGIAEGLELLANLATTHGEWEWSARVHGAAELQREAIGMTILPFLRPLHDESVAALHEHLAPAELEARWIAGREAPLEKIVTEALER